jgi:amino-acid N-acetyltransferase
MEATLRRALVSDVPAVRKMVNECADQGQMLPRSLNDLYETVRDYVVAEHRSRVVGCAALHVTWEDLAEVRSVAVRERYRRSGIGRELVQYCIEDARALGIPRLFVLTYVPDYFAKFGFRTVETNELPKKVWAECIRCPKFPDCGEVGMILDL